MLCNLCGKSDTDVVCQGCGYSFHRRTCWANHQCGILTDKDGNLVELGNILVHTFDSDQWHYLVTEIIPSYTKGGVCVGNRIRRKSIDPNKYILRTRLMQLVHEE